MRMPVCTYAQACGPQLRTDDPSVLTDIIAAINAQKSAEVCSFCTASEALLVVLSLPSCCSCCYNMQQHGSLQPVMRFMHASPTAAFPATGSSVALPGRVGLTLFHKRRSPKTRTMRRWWVCGDG